MYKLFLLKYFHSSLCARKIMNFVNICMDCPLSWVMLIFYYYYSCMNSNLHGLWLRNWCTLFYNFFVLLMIFLTRDKILSNLYFFLIYILPAAMIQKYVVSLVCIRRLLLFKYRKQNEWMNVSNVCIIIIYIIYHFV